MEAGNVVKEKTKASSKTTLSDDARERLAAPPTETTESIKERAKATTPSGRKSKAAKDAEDILDMITVLSPTLGALNELAASRWAEFRHTDDELKAITIALSKVAVKHLDNVGAKYQDEIVLAAVLGGSLVDKGFRYYARVKDEKKKGPQIVQIGRKHETAPEGPAK